MVHTVDFRKTFNYFRNLFSFKNVIINKFLNICDNIAYFMCDICDFHSKIHHNPYINKRWYNILGEILQNFILVSLPLSYIAYSSDIRISILSFTFYLNKTITILWGLIYTTFHNINYSIINPQIHKDHHIKDIPYSYNTSKQKITNYGPDTLDCLFNTKYNTCIEDFNHGVYNIIILTVLLIIIKNSDIFQKVHKYL